ncbi:hypothetical protein [Nocardia jejuensis]|nr:hypothetical protein [Nocardia jejuensis]
MSPTRSSPWDSTATHTPITKASSAAIAAICGLRLRKSSPVR